MLDDFERVDRLLVGATRNLAGVGVELRVFAARLAGDDEVAVDLHRGKLLGVKLAGVAGTLPVG